MKYNIINKLFKITLVITLLFSVSCEDDLADMNVNPNALTELDYGMQLTKIQLASTGGSYEMFRASLGYAFSSIQQMADIQSPVSGVFLPGDKYLNDPLFASSFFEEAYRQQYKNLEDYLVRTAEDPEAGNYNAMGRIMRVLTSHRLTDIYGDIPYSEAGKGYTENIWQPKYDAQKNIYAHMLAELEAAGNQLNASGENPGVNDVIFEGDIAKWKKFANSLMLRLGMRMSKVDPAGAESWVKKAISGGVMSSNDDIVRITHESAGHRNPFWGGFETRVNIRLAKTFVDWMESKGDPRLDIISTVDSGGAHKGLPNGYDETTINGFEGGSDLSTYSNLNPALRADGAPSLHVTYAEVELLLAEAVERGWHSGNAETHYNNAVHAGISQFAIFDGVSVPDSAEIDAYLTANAFDSSNALEMIGEQYWIATFLVNWEGYSNWRRTGYPALTPVNYNGNATNGQIPRRLTYSGKEYSSNGDNLNAAVAAQGPDTFMTRIWWDQ